MYKDELIHDIGQLLLEDPKIQSRKPWQHLALVIQIRPGSTSASGFIYRKDGEAVPSSPRNKRIIDKLEELQEVMREPGENPWKAAIVRITETSLKITIDFVYENPEKWLISPNTVKQMAETLRPNP